MNNDKIPGNSFQYLLFALRKALSQELEVELGVKGNERGTDKSFPLTFILWGGERITQKEPRDGSLSTMNQCSRGTDQQSSNSVWRSKTASLRDVQVDPKVVSKGLGNNNFKKNLEAEKSLMPACQCFLLALQYTLEMLKQENINRLLDLEEKELVP